MLGLKIRRVLAHRFTYLILLEEKFVDSLPKDAADLHLLKSRPS